MQFLLLIDVHKNTKTNLMEENDFNFEAIVSGQERLHYRKNDKV